MAEDVSDLVVRMRPDGVDETVQGLNQAEEATEETTGAMQGQADAAEGFLQKFQGAMGAAVAGLAVAAAGLLSKVPVIGAAMQGLFSIVEAVALQMDSVLRPVLQPVANGFFKISNAIFKMNGPLGKAVGILGTMAAIFAGALLAPISATTAAVIALAGGFTLLLSELGLLKPILSGIVDLTKALINVFVAATQGTDAFVQALGELGMVFRNIATGAAKLFINAITGMGSLIASLIRNTDWIQVGKDIVRGIAAGINLLAQIGFALGKAVIDMVLFLMNQIRKIDWIQVGKGIVNGIKEGINALAKAGMALGKAAANIAGAIKDKVTGIDWIQVGKNLIEAIANGIKKAGSVIKDAIKAAAGKLKKFLPSSPAEKGPLSDLDQTGPALVETFASGIEANTSRLATAGAAVGEAANPDSGDQTANITNGDRQSIIEVDGRVLGETTSRKQRSITASRNIDG